MLKWCFLRSPWYSAGFFRVCLKLTPTTFQTSTQRCWALPEQKFFRLITLITLAITESWLKNSVQRVWNKEDSCWWMTKRCKCVDVHDVTCMREDSTITAQFKCACNINITLSIFINIIQLLWFMYCKESEIRCK